MSNIPVNPPPENVDLSLTDRELLERLGWFTRLRWFVGLFCLLLLFASHYLLGVRFHIGNRFVPLYRPVEVVLGLFAYNAAFTLLVRRLRRRGRVTRREIQRLALGQIAFDLLGVCVLVYATGGVENVFMVLTVIPLVIASELLPPALAYASAGGAAILIHALAWAEQQDLIPHVGVEWPGSVNIAKARIYADSLYVLEFTGALTVLLFGTVFLASTIASRLRRREEDLEEAYRRIRLTDDAKSFFMRKAGHELRSPLIVVGSMLKAILQTVTTLSDEHRRLIDRAQQRTHAAMTVLDDLRHYAKLQSVQGILSARAIDLGRVTGAVVDLLLPQAESAGLHLACQADEAWVQGDEELLRELITNLVVNAIQYTPSGGRIEVSVRSSADLAQVQVSDTGIGISEVAREHVFEEFFRAEEAKKVFAEGTGLGLAICKRVAEMHGGRISASGRPEGGSVFAVELPVGARVADPCRPALVEGRN